MKPPFSTMIAVVVAALGCDAEPDLDENEELIALDEFDRDEEEFIALDELDRVEEELIALEELDQVEESTDLEGPLADNETRSADDLAAHLTPKAAAYGSKYNSDATCEAVDSYMHAVGIGYHHCSWFNFPGIDDDGYYRIHP